MSYPLLNEYLPDFEQVLMEEINNGLTDVYET